MLFIYLNTYIDMYIPSVRSEEHENDSKKYP